jgi:hypothetical protein
MDLFVRTASYVDRILKGASVHSPGSLPFMDRRASLFYFAAAVPAVGFVHGPVDVTPLNEFEPLRSFLGR